MRKSKKLSLRIKLVNQSFKKQERLCSRKQTEFLFTKGKHRTLQPLRFTWIVSTVPQEFPVKVMFVVPKKLFKRAHDRNLLKRRMREAYRKNKTLLYERLIAHEKKGLLAFVYVGKSSEDYAVIEKTIVSCLEKIS
ncbi:MAG TPA: ribonuclease P protein component [Bacteroidia bacterium]|nr:ribonuclease P protein component [Bacteroidia bacterium]